MPLTDEFVAQAGQVRVPSMGTEMVAPWLYHLIRMTRPQRVLEIGMGYTTLFVARALADNMGDFERERIELRDKTRSLVGQAGVQSRTADEEGLFAWPYSAPALAAPAYYQSEYRPRFHAIDDLSNEKSSARRVLSLLETIGLSTFVAFHNGDHHAFSDSFSSDDLPFDLVWVDCDESVYIFDDYWSLVNPQGGLFFIHSLLSDSGGPEVLDYIRGSLEMRSDTFEMLHLIEPHKLSQNGVTLLRRTSGGRGNPTSPDPAGLV